MSNENSSVLYQLPEAGTEWIMTNRDKLVLWKKQGH